MSNKNRRCFISRVQQAILLLCLGTAVSACSDEREVPTAPATTARSVVSEGPLSSDFPAHDRKNNRWQRMSDAELTSAVAEAEGSVLIGFKEASRAAGVDHFGRHLVGPTAVSEGKAVLRSLGSVITYEFKTMPIVAAKISPSVTELIRHSPLVDYIEPSMEGEWGTPGANGPAAGTFLRSSSARGTEIIPYNIERVGAPEAWVKETGSGIRLLIMDSGLMWSHPDLDPSLAWRCLNSGLPADDWVGHGTHVAGIAAALQNGVHVVGVAHSVDLKSANVANAQGNPDPAEIACSLDVARLNSIDVVNMSFALGSPYTAITDLIRAAYYQDDMVFAAIASVNGTEFTYPGGLNEVIAVGSVDANDDPAWFSPVGSMLSLVAPGLDILSTSLPSGTQCSQGSLVSSCYGNSMATPHVAAAAALLKAHFPHWTAQQVHDRLLETAEDLGVPGFDPYFGHGLLDVEAALAVLQDPQLVAIAGPEVIDTAGTYTWEAIPSGFDGPYSYQWYIEYVDDGSGDELGNQAEQQVQVQLNKGSFWISVDVWSSHGMAERTKFVAVNPGGGPW
jgi:subtilisin